MYLLCLPWTSVLPYVAEETKLFSLQLPNPLPLHLDNPTPTLNLLKPSDKAYISTTDHLCGRRVLSCT